MDKMVLSRLAGKAINTPLMILPDKLQVILDVIGGRIGADDVDIKSIGFAAAGERQVITAPKSIAVVPVVGSLVHRTHGLDAMSGLTTYDDIRNDFKAALASDADAILLDIDSPGGEAAGVMDLSDEIFQARGEKPIYAVANESAFSAAYAIGSAADHLFVSRTAHVGSIGVIAIHRDQSDADAKAGVKYTAIYKGDRKTDLSPYAPLSDEGKAMLEEDVSDHYELFTATVARNRGMKIAQVIATQAGIFMGEKAVQKGLADEVASFSEVPGIILAELNGQPTQKEVMHVSNEAQGNLKPEDDKNEEVKTMNMQELKTQYPDLVSSIEDSVKGQLTEQFEEDKKALMTTHDQERDEMKATLLKLEKAEVIRQERDMKAEADRIWAKALTDVPDRLHEKVEAQVAYDKFVDKGVLDKTAFAEAVQAEVEDWEARGATSKVMGTGFSSKDVEDDETKANSKLEKEEDELADSLFAASGANREEVK